jgi:ribosome biogenesis GTPase
MGRKTKQQQNRINYKLRDKFDLKDKQKRIHDDGIPKYLERHLPYIRKLSRNLDQILIVNAFVKPELKRGLIDRLLVLAEIEQIKPIICLNKVDLLQNSQDAEDLAKIYRDIGYDTINTSAKKSIGIDQLFSLLKDHRTALAGHSGVGKSSLVNAMAPDLKIRVNEVSETTKRGKHTTTKVKIYSLDETTEIVDLPGVKIVDFIDIHKSEARLYFREFLEPAEFCKFRDCMHLTETDCAVKEAVAQGIIDNSRYESYCNFVDTLD